MHSGRLGTSGQMLLIPVLLRAVKRSFAQDEGHLLVAGVGDSRCMLGRVVPNGAVRAIALSTDHVPDNPGEAARVRLNGVSMVLGPPGTIVVTQSIVTDDLSC